MRTGGEWLRRRDGYAPWTVVTKAETRIIGWGGLINDPFYPRVGFSRARCSVAGSSHRALVETVGNNREHQCHRC
jgi:hypothetical protein